MPCDCADAQDAIIDLTTARPAAQKTHKKRQTASPRGTRIHSPRATHPVSQRVQKNKITIELTKNSIDRPVSTVSGAGMIPQKRKATELRNIPIRGQTTSQPPQAIPVQRTARTTHNNMRRGRRPASTMSSYDRRIPKKRQAKKRPRTAPTSNDDAIRVISAEGMRAFS